MSFTYSLYIPRVFKGISQEQIRGTFYGQSIGKVGRVDLLKVYNEKNDWVYNKAFVHFDEWFVNETATTLQQSIESGKGNAKIVYEHERFWMLLPNASKTIPNEELNNTEQTETPPANMQAMMMPRMHPVIPTLYPGVHYQPMIPQHILLNPYGYMEPPADIGNKDRYYTNYTAAHHAYFSQPIHQHPQQMQKQFSSTDFPPLQRSSAHTDDVDNQKK